jgi:hypothetical protein
VQVVVDLSSGSVSLGGPDDLERFSVLALPASPGDRDDTAALGAVAAALSVHDAGIVDPDGNAFIPIEAVRRLAQVAAADQGSSLGDDWESRFTAMVERAAGRGWTTDEGTIRAHIEWDRP